MGYQLKLVVLFNNSLHNYANACLFLAHCLGETVATRSQAETCECTFYVTEKDTKLLKTHTPKGTETPTTVQCTSKVQLLSNDTESSHYLLV